MGHAITEEQKAEEARRLAAMMANTAEDPEEAEPVNLSFEQVYEEFKARKFAYRKANRRNPTAVMVGQIEMAVFQQNIPRLRAKKLIQQKGRRLWIQNMMVIATEAESMIMPLHGDMSQLDSSPWLKFLGIR